MRCRLPIADLQAERSSMRFGVRSTLMSCCLAALLFVLPAIAQEAAPGPAQEVTPDVLSRDAAAANAPAPDAAAPNAPALPPAPAVVMTGPRITTMDVDWNAARTA